MESQPLASAVFERLKSIEGISLRTEQQIREIRDTVEAHNVWIAANSVKIEGLQESRDTIIDALGEYRKCVEGCGVEDLKKEIQEVKGVAKTHDEYILQQRGGWRALSQAGSLVAGVCALLLVVLEIIRNFGGKHP